MPGWLRGLIIAVCVVALFYLVYDFAIGIADDPAMQPASSASPAR